MKALHDIRPADPWAGIFDPWAPLVRTWDEGGVLGRDDFLRFAREMRDAPLMPYQRQYIEGTFRQNPRPRDVYFHEYPGWMGAGDWTDPLSQRRPEPMNTRDVAARLTADDAELRRANFGDRYALTATRGEVRALTQAGYFHEGATLTFRGRPIAVTG